MFNDRKEAEFFFFFVSFTNNFCSFTSSSSPCQVRLCDHVDGFTLSSENAGHASCQEANGVGHCVPVKSQNETVPSTTGFSSSNEEEGNQADDEASDSDTKEEDAESLSLWNSFNEAYPSVPSPFECRMEEEEVLDNALPGCSTQTPNTPTLTSAFRSQSGAPAKKVGVSCVSLTSSRSFHSLGFSPSGSIHWSCGGGLHRQWRGSPQPLAAGGQWPLPIPEALPGGGEADRLLPRAAAPQHDVPIPLPVTHLPQCVSFTGIGHSHELKLVLLQELNQNMQLLFKAEHSRHWQTGQTLLIMVLCSLTLMEIKLYKKYTFRWYLFYYPVCTCR